jgi:Zn-finger nucleic acid-binding protein
MALNTRGYYVCAHCGTTSFPETVSRDGIDIVGPGEPVLRCSACSNPLVHALLDECQVEYCETCRGLLVPRRDFAEIVRRRRAWAQSQSVTPEHADAAELRRKINCPKCGGRMATDWYYGPGNVIMDRCVGCDLVWLDYGELKRIVDAPGIDRGSRDRT